MLSNKSLNQLSKRIQIRNILYHVVNTTLVNLSAGLKELALSSYQDASNILGKTVPIGHLIIATDKKKITEAVSKEQAEQIKDAIFEQIPKDKLDAIVLGGPAYGRKSWHARIAQQTQLAPPDQIAALVTTGYLQGETPTALAKRLRPWVQGVASSARRVARNESMRIAHATRMEAYENMGDMVVGYQIHATMDTRVRPEHAARSGTIYYKKPVMGQLGLDKMPQPPLEEDGTVAHNCRCWITPVLEVQSQVEDNPAAKALFTDNKDKLIPNPAVYNDWFDRASESDKERVVGKSRLKTIRNQLGAGEKISWGHFVNPNNGSLIDTDVLKNEHPNIRIGRLEKFDELMADRKELTNKVYNYGYLPPEKPPAFVGPIKPPQTEFEKYTNGLIELARQAAAKAAAQKAIDDINLAAKQAADAAAAAEAASQAAAAKAAADLILAQQAAAAKIAADLLAAKQAADAAAAAQAAADLLAAQSAAAAAQAAAQAAAAQAANNALNGPLTQAQAQAAVKLMQQKGAHATYPDDYFDEVEKWPNVGGQAGSNEGGVYQDVFGSKHYVKKPKSLLHAENEILTSAFYDHLGVKSVQVKKGYRYNQVVTVSPIEEKIGDLDKFMSDPSVIKKLQKGFCVDAWLANWDAVGNLDNVIVNKNKDPIRVDPGGALLFRAQGSPKGSAFNEDVNELNTLIDPNISPNGYTIFGGMTKDDKTESAKELLKITPIQIEQYVTATITDKAKAADLIKVLIARRAKILKEFGVDDDKPVASVIKKVKTRVSNKVIVPVVVPPKPTKAEAAALKTLIANFGQDSDVAQAAILAAKQKAAIRAKAIKARAAQKFALKKKGLPLPVDAVQSILALPAKEKNHPKVISWAERKFKDEKKREAFLKFFGKSQAVTEKGNPEREYGKVNFGEEGGVTRLYHGSSANWGAMPAQFSHDQYNRGEGADMAGRGFYLTNNNTVANMYAGDTVGSHNHPVYLRTENPFVFYKKVEEGFEGLFKNALIRNVTDGITEKGGRQQYGHRIRPNGGKQSTMEVFNVNRFNRDVEAKKKQLADQGLPFLNYHLWQCGANALDGGTKNVNEALIRLGFDSVKHETTDGGGSPSDPIHIIRKDNSTVGATDGRTVDRDHFNATGEYRAKDRSLKNGWSTVYVAFNPEDIKSAIGNRGTYDRTSQKTTEQKQKKKKKKS